MQLKQAEGPDADTPAAVACPICLGAATRQGQVKRLLCSHEFHQSCVDKWLNRSRNCPLCRTPIPRRRMRRPHRNRRPHARTRFFFR
ncbi:hypothetical protein AVEN_61310-1 [Araneus ventricosus]|uniref:RING-type domain-containing protein n=1 Tax=Araneus ventricosus TaxID=182803 RepID=A0A4Y2A7X8_ARAVE|nr:hypothetical protein AVEN_61310-1 [Araneus ventricosus]